jgi:hypothetical protein
MKVLCTPTVTAHVADYATKRTHSQRNATATIYTRADEISVHCATPTHTVVLTMPYAELIRALQVAGYRLTHNQIPMQTLIV